MQRPTVSWRDLVAWYTGAVVLCIIGTYGQYHGVFSSDAARLWQLKSGVDTAYFDSIRAVISALFALFALYNLGVVPMGNDETVRNIGTRQLTKSEKWMCVSVLLLLALVAFIALPWNFQRTMASPDSGFPAARLSLRETWAPYVPYALYVFGLWFGIVFPVFFALVRSVRIDSRDSRLRRVELDNVARASEIITKRTVSDYVDNSNEYLNGLSDAANRYIPLFLIVITVCLIEQLTTLHCSVTPFASDLGKIALWVLIIPAMLASVIVFMFLYDDGIRAARRGLSEMINRLQQPGTDEEALDDAREARQTLIEKRSSTNALLAVLKTGTVGVYILVIIISACTAAALRLHENWAEAFFPRAVIAWSRTHLPRLPLQEKKLVEDAICAAPQPVLRTKSAKH